MLDNLELNAIPDSVDNAVENLTDELTKTAGHTFSDIWYLVFGGISHAADKKRMKYAHDIECYRQELSSRIRKIPANKLIEPNIQVTAQALENSKYCIESGELRKMFSNLIANSMNSDHADTAHPSYAEIIKQMSPTDARVLKTIPLNSLIPIVDYVVDDKSKGTHTIRLSNVYLSGLKGLNIFKECASISSLTRLGLLSVDTSTCIYPTTVYGPYSETPFFKKLFDDVRREDPPKKAVIAKYYGKLTPLGQNFVRVCVQ